jgi:hypothetical protein
MIQLIVEVERFGWLSCSMEYLDVTQTSSSSSTTSGENHYGDVVYWGSLLAWSTVRSNFLL